MYSSYSHVGSSGSIGRPAKDPAIKEKQLARLARISSQAQVEAEAIMGQTIQTRVRPGSLNTLSAASLAAPLEPSASRPALEHAPSYAARAQTAAQQVRPGPGPRTNRYGDAYHPSAGHVAPMRRVPSHNEKGMAMTKKVKEQVDMRYRNLNKAFQSLDHGKDHRLCTEDLLKAVAAWNLHCSPEDVDALIKHCDENHDGHIDYGEFQRGMAKLEATYGHVQPGYFGNNDSKVVRGYANVGGGGQVIINDNFHHTPSDRMHVAPMVLTNPLPETDEPATAADLRRFIDTLHERVKMKYKMIRVAFRALDENKDGHLSPDEIVKAVEHFNLPIPANQVHMVFHDIADVDSNGKLSYAEFATLLEDMDVSLIEQSIQKQKARLGI